MPYPLAFLVGRNSWTTIILRVGWHRDLDALHQRKRSFKGPIDGWPPPDAAVWHNKGKRQNTDAGSLGDVSSMEPGTLDTFSLNVRALCADYEDGKPFSKRRKAEMEMVVSAMDRWSYTWKQHLGMLNISGGGHKYKHSSEKLLSCIRLSSSIKGGEFCALSLRDPRRGIASLRGFAALL